MVYPQPLNMIATSMVMIRVLLKRAEGTLEDGPGCLIRDPLKGMACPFLVAGDRGLHVCLADQPIPPGIIPMPPIPPIPPMPPMPPMPPL